MMNKSGNDHISIIILAAGASARMGQSKQKLLVSGKSLLNKTIDTALDSNIGKVIVVLGSEEKEHRKLITNNHVEIVFNSHWQNGMGSSLKEGLHHVLNRNEKTSAVMILVCDQPLLTSQHLKLLNKKYQKTQSSIVASTYSGTLGVPAVFSHQHFDELLKLQDEQGAKKTIQQHIVETVAFPEGEIDLDTPQDYQNFLQKQSKKMP
jgi:molybdenum cofactor cytidylyltransferase